jgi:serine/threonine protein kinase
VLTQPIHPQLSQATDWGELDDGSLFVVFPLYSNGNLTGGRKAFVGDALASLRCVEGILQPLSALHQRDTVHRDIKPQNILVAEDGRCVLADLGLVFNQNDRDSVTLTGERVGNWEFGPDWANRDEHQRSKAVDLYATGKLLWWLASGQPLLRREDWQRRECDLIQLFPDQPDMHSINKLLARVVVAEPEEVTFADATEMRLDVLRAIEECVSGRVRGPQLRVRCLACQTGRYRPIAASLLSELENWKNSMQLSDHKDLVVGIEALRCDSCGHLTWFAPHSN